MHKPIAIYHNISLLRQRLITIKPEGEFSTGGIFYKFWQSFFIAFLFSSVSKTFRFMYKNLLDCLPELCGTDRSQSVALDVVACPHSTHSLAIACRSDTLAAHLVASTSPSFAIASPSHRSVASHSHSHALHTNPHTCFFVGAPRTPSPTMPTPVRPRLSPNIQPFSVCHMSPFIA